MASQIINEFTQFELTTEEQLAGSVLSIVQTQALQNIRAEYSVAKLNLLYTPEDRDSYIQAEAELTGWIKCITYLLDSSRASQEVIMNTIEQNREEEGEDNLLSPDPLSQIFS